MSAKNENLDSENWILILNTKLEFYNRIWVDRNLEQIQKFRMVYFTM